MGLLKQTRSASSGGRGMAIFSLNHKAIGKTTQERPYTAAAHVNYITRPKAMSRLEGARMPVSKDGGIGFFRSAEDRDRKNGRVADKVMLALPVELTPDQRAELLRGFADEVTGGKASWLAAFHDKGKDAANPHCHLLIRDRDPETGRRVFGMSEKGSTERLRLLWEAHANQALEKAGRPERIDHRTLEAQGKPGPAGLHIGPKPKAMAERGRDLRSQARTIRNRPGANTPARRVDYPALDRGRSRADTNAERRAARERDGWATIDADRQGRELEELRHLHVGRAAPSMAVEGGGAVPEGRADARPGPSFSERMRQQREALARDPEAQKARDTRDLSRMRASREQDKDRER